jgi:hypothetical protein
METNMQNQRWLVKIVLAVFVLCASQSVFAKPKPVVASAEDFNLGLEVVPERP